MEGFGSYRDPCHLDLSDIRMAVILGSNGAGKSTIPEALLWALYGETNERGADEVLNSDSDEAKVTAVFDDADGARWTVRRARTRSSRQVATATSSRGAQVSGHKAVVQAIGTVLNCDAKVLCATSFSRQGAAGMFATGSASARREILQRGLSHMNFAEMLDTSIRHEEVVKDKSTLAEDAYNRAKELAGEMAQRKETLASREIAAAEAEEQLSVLEETITDPASSRAAAALREARRAAEELATTKASIATAVANAEAATDRARSAELELSGLLTALQEANEAAETADEKSQAAKEAAAAAKEAASRAPERLRALEVSDGAECWVCGGPLTPEHIAALRDEQEKLIETADRRRRSAELRSQELGRARQAATNASAAVDNARERISEAISAAERLQGRATDLGATLAALESRSEWLADLEEAARAEDDNNEAAQRLERARTAANRAREAVGDAKRRLEEAENAQRSLPELRASAEKAEASKVHASWLVRAMRPTGIPQVAMQRVTDTISRVANRELSEMGDLQTRFVAAAEDSKNMTISARNIGGPWRSYETFSGGERMRVDVALRIAMCEVLGIRCGLLVIDEGMGTLDDQGIGQFSGVLHRLVRDDVVQQVLMVTHVAKAAEVFPAKIEVSKDEESSRAVLLTA